MTTNSIALKTAALKEAIEEYDGKVPFAIGADKKTVIPFIDENKDLLEFLQDYVEMSSAQSVALTKWLCPPLEDGKTLADVTAKSVNEFYGKISFMNQSEDPVIEVKIVDKWYPVKASVSKYKTFSGHVIELLYYAQLGALRYEKRVYVAGYHFIDDFDAPVTKTFNEVFAERNIRVATKESVEKAKKLNEEVITFSTKVNQVYDAWGTGITYSDYWGFDDINVGWKDSPTMIIVEPLLENRNAHREIDFTDQWNLPFVRAFSMKHKAFIYVDIESMTQHSYFKDGKRNIVLPNNMMTALNSVFDAKRENLFGDLFRGRHGGIVVLANGPSGVGKTLTAEVFAEYQERPLYSIEMSEIGTTVKEVEANLQRIFSRAKKWNAVLLFDEADIFLSERVASDLERSAIVGIFLRLLDYYEGTFFLTTNRGEGIDKAFKSRVTLYLNYPELTNQTRETIWKNMLKAANTTVEVDITWAEVSEKKLNGRQIRNQVRLLKLMYPGQSLRTSDIVKSLEFTAI